MNLSIRGLLRIRYERALPRRSRKPAIGAYVVCGELRMTVQAGVGMVNAAGLARPQVRPDQRHYLVVPAHYVTELIDAPGELRSRVLSIAVSHASLRPIIGDPMALPPNIVRN
jgi:hypothetical protein